MKIHTLALALIASAATVAAQAPAAATGGARLGVSAGFNLATFSGKDIQGAENKSGFGGGVYLAIPVAPQIEFQPELLYTAKGAKSSDAGFEAAVRLNYVEIPLLARVNFPTSSDVTPHLYLGPAIAFKAGCSLSASGNGISTSAGCDGLTDDAGQPISIAAVDFGAVVGGGLGFNVGGQRATVGVRYDLGLKNITSGGGESKNRTLSFLASFEMPLPR
jgi:hypothetical protein